MPQPGGTGRFATVSEYLTYVKNKVVVTFKRHPEHMPTKVRCYICSVMGNCVCV